MAYHDAIKDCDECIARDPKFGALSFITQTTDTILVVFFFFSRYNSSPLTRLSEGVHSEGTGPRGPQGVPQGPGRVQ
jgi:hypothetical protein